MGKKDKRFEVVHDEGINLGTSAKILKDTKTGVQYLFITNGYNGGLTPIIDKDGKPIIDEN